MEDYYIGPDNIDALQSLKKALQECVSKRLENNAALIKKLHQFIEFSYEMLKIYEHDKHELSDEFRQTQYEHLILFCFALQAVPEALHNTVIQQEVQHVSEEIGLEYPIDIMDCCDIFDKVIRLDENILSEYNLTYVLLKLENPITKKEGMHDFLKMLKILLAQLDVKEPGHVFLSVVAEYVERLLA